MTDDPAEEIIATPACACRHWDGYECYLLRNPEATGWEDDGCDCSCHDAGDEGEDWDVSWT